MEVGETGTQMEIAQLPVAAAHNQQYDFVTTLCQPVMVIHVQGMLQALRTVTRRPVLPVLTTIKHTKKVKKLPAMKSMMEHVQYGMYNLLFYSIMAVHVIQVINSLNHESI